MFKMKVIYSGLESSGKSLKLAKVIRKLVIRNAAWNKKYKKDRFIASNMEFTPVFIDWAAQQGVRIIYWVNLDDLVTFSECDVIIDEVGNYFDARFWEKLSLDVRNWITQGAKVGIEIYGSAQFFGQVDISFRRLVNHLYYITKLVGSPRPAATRPPVETIWGLCAITEQDPKLYDKENDSFKRIGLMPNFFLIQKKDCEIFYTGQKIQRPKPLKYKHIVRECEIPNCPHLSAHYKVQHV